MFSNEAHSSIFIQCRSGPEFLVQSGSKPIPHIIDPQESHIYPRNNFIGVQVILAKNVISCSDAAFVIVLVLVLPSRFY